MNIAELNLYLCTYCIQHGAPIAYIVVLRKSREQSVSGVFTAPYTKCILHIFNALIISAPCTQTAHCTDRVYMHLASRLCALFVLENSPSETIAAWVPNAYISGFTIAYCAKVHIMTVLTVNILACTAMLIFQMHKAHITWVHGWGSKMYHTAQPCHQMKLRAQAHRHDMKRAGSVYFSIVKTKENEEPSTTKCYSVLT